MPDVHLALKHRSERSQVYKTPDRYILKRSNVNVMIYNIWDMKRISLEKFTVHYSIYFSCNIIIFYFIHFFVVII